MQITLPDLKAHLRLDLADTSEDDLLAAKIQAAEAWVAAYIGTDYGSTAPAPVLEATRQLAAHLYDEREGDADTIPAATLALLSPCRSWTF